MAMAEVFVGIETEIRTMMARYECERSLFAIRWAGGAPGSSACMPACNS